MRRPGPDQAHRGEHRGFRRQLWPCCSSRCRWERGSRRLPPREKRVSPGPSRGDRSPRWRRQALRGSRRSACAMSQSTRLFSLSLRLAGLSVLLDETVSGTVSLVLHEASPLETLQAIADAANLYLSDRDGIVRVSRLRLDRAPGGRWILESRGGSLSAITRALTASAGASVVLPHREYPPITVSLTARTLGGLVAQLAEAIGASVSQRSGLYVIGDDDAVVSDPESFADSPAPREMPRLTRHAGDVALSVSGARRIDILRALAADLGLPLIICGDLSSVIGEIELSAPEDRFLPVLATALHVRIYRDGGSLVVVDEYDSGRLRGLYHRTLLPVPPAHRPLIREAASTVPDLHIEGESARGLVVTGWSPRCGGSRRFYGSSKTRRAPWSFFDTEPLTDRQRSFSRRQISAFPQTLSQRCRPEDTWSGGWQTIGRRRSRTPSPSGTDRISADGIGVASSRYPWRSRRWSASTPGSCRSLPGTARPSVSRRHRGCTPPWRNSCCRWTVPRNSFGSTCASSSTSRATPSSMA
jgi:hypothetical protein